MQAVIFIHAYYKYTSVESQVCLPGSSQSTKTTLSGLDTEGDGGGEGECL